MNDSNSQISIQNFLSHWRSEYNEAFDLVKSTVQSIEDSFHSPTALVRPFSEPLKHQKLSDERVYSQSENSEFQSASTSYGSIDSSLKNNLSQLVTRDSHTKQRFSEEVEKHQNRLKPSIPLCVKTQKNPKQHTPSSDDCFESPLIKRRRNTLPYSEFPTIQGFKAIEEDSKPEGSDSSDSPKTSKHKDHSPMLQVKPSQTAEPQTSTLNLCMLSVDYEPSNRSQKLSLSSSRNLPFQQFDVELEEGLFTDEFIENVYAIRENCVTLRETFERIIEYIFCTKNLDESFFKSYPRSEIIYSIQIDSRFFLDLLKKVIAALKNEEFQVRKEFNDGINFLETKFEKFIRQIGATQETFRIFKGKLKIDEIELKKLHERVFHIVRTFAIKDKTRKILREFIFFTQKHINTLPSNHPVKDRAPEDYKIAIEYVTVRKLLEKLAECNRTILAKDLLETVIFNYDHFISPINLLLFLIKKYYTPRPLMMTFMEYRHFKGHQSSTTKQRILDIVKFWIEERQGDFERSSDLLTLLITFIESIYKIEKEVILKDDFRSTCERVQVILENIQSKQRKEEYNKTKVRRAQKQRVSTFINLNCESITPAPVSNLQKLLRISKFRSTHNLYKKIQLTGDEDFLMVWEAREIARQLTLVEHKLFCKIDIYEMLKKRWNHSEFSYECYNVTALIRRFNSFSFWVQYVVLYQDSDDDRYIILSKFLSVAIHCLELKNFNTAQSIYAALMRLNTNGIWRASTAEEADYARLQEKFKSGTIYQDMDREYQVLEEAAVPCITYFTKVFFRLQDNVNFFIRFEGSDKYLKTYMLSQITESAKLMRKFQKKSYDINKNEQMYNFFKRDYKLKNNINFDNDDAEQVLRNRMKEMNKSLQFTLTRQPEPDLV